jgi:hypothetical protein
VCSIERNASGNQSCWLLDDRARRLMTADESIAGTARRPSRGEERDKEKSCDANGEDH